MQFKDTFRLSALFICASALLFSCITVDKSLADGFISDEQKTFLKTVEFPLPLTMMPADSLQGASGNEIIIGSFRTAEFGESNFSCTANISLNGKLNFGEGAIVKSIFINMPKYSTQYLDASQEGIGQNIKVYRTTRTIDSTTLYNNSINESDYNHSPISINQTSYFGGDTLKIYLNNSLGEEIIKLEKRYLDSNSLFIKKIKGLYLDCAPPDQNLIGGRLNSFILENSAIVMKINFKPTWKSDLERKDTTIYFRFGNGFCLNTSKYHSYTNSSINSPNLSELPIEGIAGIKPYISASAIKEMIDKWIAKENLNPNKIVVSKANIELPFEPTVNYNYDNYPKYLYPSTRNKNSNYFYQPLNDIYSASNNIGRMNRSLNNYSGDISAAVQGYINGSHKGIRSTSNLWFFPTISTVNAYKVTSYHSSTNTYNVAKINGPAAKRYPKLTIVYTVVK